MCRDAQVVMTGMLDLAPAPCLCSGSPGSFIDSACMAAVVATEGTPAVLDCRMIAWMHDARADFPKRILTLNGAIGAPPRQLPAGAPARWLCIRAAHRPWVGVGGTPAPHQHRSGHRLPPRQLQPRPWRPWRASSPRVPARSPASPGRRAGRCRVPADLPSRRCFLLWGWASRPPPAAAPA